MMVKQSKLRNVYFDYILSLSCRMITDFCPATDFYQLFQIKISLIADKIVFL